MARTPLFDEVLLTTVRAPHPKILPSQIGVFFLPHSVLCYNYYLPWSSQAPCGPGSLVGIATGYELDGTGSNPGGDEIFRLSRPALGLTHPSVQWVPGLSPGEEWPGRDADPSPLLVPWSRKSRAIPLLPLWAVRPVQSLSACTRVHFTFFNQAG